MDIGRPTRIIEIEPASLPVPETVPLEPSPIPDPLPAHEPLQSPVEPPA